MLIEILILLLAFQVKHLIADYYLQFEYMYGTKGKDKGWFKGLFDHSGIHAIGTFIILYIYGLAFSPNEITIDLIAFLSLFDMAIHFFTDRWKATQKVGPDTAVFWENLGIDQFIHHVTGIIIVWSVV